MDALAPKFLSYIQPSFRRKPESIYQQARWWKDRFRLATE
jgi:hypothetical protein